jgi:N5-(cytidine 5'-diphosphoramidyl)-L-glutamine hydrolase
VPNDRTAVIAWLTAVEPHVICLSNGNDWGEAEERDQVEKALFDFARERGIPVLGVCRGLQALNILCGGGVTCLDEKGRKRHIATRHTVRIVDPGWISMLGRSEFTANSYHGLAVHQDQIAADLRVFAISEDGFVEGLYHRSKPMMAVQWHPERQGSDQEVDRKLLVEFLCGNLMKDHTSP